MVLPMKGDKQHTRGAQNADATLAA
jgi:hypothetical protein